MFIYFLILFQLINATNFSSDKIKNGEKCKIHTFLQAVVSSPSRQGQISFPSNFLRWTRLTMPISEHFVSGNMIFPERFLCKRKITRFGNKNIFWWNSVAVRECFYWAVINLAWIRCRENSEREIKSYSWKSQSKLSLIL